MTTADGAAGRIATGLGLFSIGLGLAEIVAPGGLARFVGVRDRDRNRNRLRRFGVREIAAGVGILTQPRRPRWMWARVAGDAADLTALGCALASRGTNKTRAAAATAAVAGVTALDVYCGARLSVESPRRARTGEGRIVKTIVINRSPEEVYETWRNLENAPRFMSYIERVETTGGRRSHWRARLPGGRNIEWDAELTGDQPGRLIAWRSAEGSPVHHSGTVRFDPAPGNRGTLVRVDLEFAPPGGHFGAHLSSLLGLLPAELLERDLRALKQLIETGEVARSESSIFPGMHAAQPPEQVPEEVLATR